MTVHTDIALPARTGGIALLHLLRAHGYAFITPTPSTHQRVLKARGSRPAATMRDVLGWSVPFEANILPAPLLAALDQAGLVERRGDLLAATLRVSSLGDDLFLHSAFPPDAEDTVFFGPDTYRFATFLNAVLDGTRADTLAEIGTGSGAGAVVAARACGARRIIATDLNPQALALARLNFAAAEVEADLRLGSGLDPIVERPDLIIANPPYISGTSGRTYRDGGDMHGARLSLDWALAGSEKLAPRGRFILYTGASILDGMDPLRAALEDRLDPARFKLSYRELDPDIFGELIGGAGYEDVERIAAVGAVITRCA